MDDFFCFVLGFKFFSGCGKYSGSVFSAYSNGKRILWRFCGQDLCDVLATVCFDIGEKYWALELLLEKDVDNWSETGKGYANLIRSKLIEFECLGNKKMIH